MGQYNFLVEGVSGTGKTSVCRELCRRGVQAINGDTDLAYQGDPVTGEPSTTTPSHEQHIWDVDAVRTLAANRDERFTFFCGGSRNFARFRDAFDEVFVLDVDEDTLRSRLSRRSGDEFGGRPDELAFILRVHALGTDVPADAVLVDATQPLDAVVERLLHEAERAAGAAPGTADPP